MDEQKKARFEKAMQALCDQHDIELILKEPIVEFAGECSLSVEDAQWLLEVMQRVAGVSTQQSVGQSPDTQQQGPRIYDDDGRSFSLEQIIYHNHRNGTWVLVSPVGRLFGGVTTDNIEEILKRAAEESADDVERGRQEVLEKAKLLMSGVGGHG